MAIQNLTYGVMDRVTTILNWKFILICYDLFSNNSYCYTVNSQLQVNGIVESSSDTNSQLQVNGIVESSSDTNSQPPLKNVSRVEVSE